MVRYRNFPNDFLAGDDVFAYLALRATWFASALVHVGLLVFGRAKLSTEKIEAARSAAAPTAS